MIKLLLQILLSQNASNVNPVRLEKQSKSKFEVYCEKLCPYIIFACAIILCVLLFVALARYGHMLSTEANNYEHLSQIVAGG